LKKTRYNVIPFYYIIWDISGKSITISVADGSVKTVTKSLILPLRSNEMSLKQAKTIPGTSGGSVTEILCYNSKKNTYKVRFELEGDEDEIDVISAKE
jgi:hypothetical protein